MLHVEQKCVCQYVGPGMMPQSISEECICFEFALSLHSTAAHVFIATDAMTFPNKHGASLAIH